MTRQQRIIKLFGGLLIALHGIGYGVGVGNAAPASFDGQYTGTSTGEAGTFRGNPCPTQPIAVSMIIRGGVATLELNPRTKLTFSGSVANDGSLVIPGQNNLGGSGFWLSGRIILRNGKFYGKTSGLACNAQINLQRS